MGSLFGKSLSLERAGAGATGDKDYMSLLA